MEEEEKNPTPTPPLDQGREKSETQTPILNPSQEEGLSEPGPEQKVETEIPAPDSLPFGEGEGGVSVERNGNDVTISEVMTPPSPPVPTKPSQKNLWSKFLEKVSFNKAKKLEKILELARKKGKVTNDDIEKLLHVSHATATRYLDALEKEGKIKQIGGRGKYTHYELIQ